MEVVGYSLASKDETEQKTEVYQSEQHCKCGKGNMQENCSVWSAHIYIYIYIYIERERERERERAVSYTHLTLPTMAVV